MSSANTGAAGTGSTGTGIGAKIKGTVDVIHGIGESLRGRAMGAVDTAIGHDGQQHASIATKGREEAEMGIARMKGQSGTTTGSAANPPADAVRGDGTRYPGTGAAPGREEQYNSGAQGGQHGGHAGLGRSGDDRATGNLVQGETHSSGGLGRGLGTGAGVGATAAGLEGNHHHPHQYDDTNMHQNQFGENEDNEPHAYTGSSGTGLGQQEPPGTGAPARQLAGHMATGHYEGDHASGDSAAGEKHSSSGRGRELATGAGVGAAAADLEGSHRHYHHHNGAGQNQDESGRTGADSGLGSGIGTRTGTNAAPYGARAVPGQEEQYGTSTPAGQTGGYAGSSWHEGGRTPGDHSVGERGHSIGGLGRGATTGFGAGAVAAAVEGRHRHDEDRTHNEPHNSSHRFGGNDVGGAEHTGNGSYANFTGVPSVPNKDYSGLGDRQVGSDSRAAGAGQQGRTAEGFGGSEVPGVPRGGQGAARNDQYGQNNDHSSVGNGLRSRGDGNGSGVYAHAGQDSAHDEFGQGSIPGISRHGQGDLKAAEYGQGHTMGDRTQHTASEAESGAYSGQGHPSQSGASVGGFGQSGAGQDGSSFAGVPGVFQSDKQYDSRQSEIPSDRAPARGQSEFAGVPGVLQQGDQSAGDAPPLPRRNEQPNVPRR
ncbi:hypothetical protein HETIRDRAFT_388036 [Heterobasidion irregulare TC 32-1]|uniref:Uncharacterized protein n=1 Tax=Heterobasidion irregulare (strain TC 32-1) TaxID=747525 RepID=W4JYN1_HETIT|nr:uncharacterized protein HETIRDRAFT_388036 [Heterobasidion irregulare TC 32-1]ETW77971.1 hypothetical protein HETIRDRAFT_388036 [Heterobasidion irregulare TC 32-1]